MTDRPSQTADFPRPMGAIPDARPEDAASEARRTISGLVGAALNVLSEDHRRPLISQLRADLRQFDAADVLARTGRRPTADAWFARIREELADAADHLEADALDTLLGDLHVDIEARMAALAQLADRRERPTDAAQPATPTTVTEG